MISATIITLNEQRNIKKVLQGLKGVVDEVVIVDSGSIDKTVEFAKESCAKVFYREFDNFSNQKNFAASKTEGDWILSMDADEELPKELGEEIKKSVKKNEFSAYLIPRRNFILGGEIKHSRWSPDKHIWLWKKSFGKWVGEVHEEVKVNGKVGELKTAKLHYQRERISGFIKSNDLYSSILAKSLFKKGIKFSLFRLFWDSTYEFFLRYIYKLGFLDGWRGFVLAYLMAIYKITVWIKVWELEIK